LVVNMFSCTQAQLEKVILADDQATLFPNSYDSYVRTDEYDAVAFASKHLDMATWTNSVSNTFPVNDSYTSTLNGSLRRVPKDGTTFTNSDVLLARTWLPAPATFSASSASWFRHDYEIEIFWEESPGRVFHVYGMWRDVKVGSFNLTLN